MNEENIEKEKGRALRRVDVLMVGPGAVGGALLRHVAVQHASLRKRGVDLRVPVIADGWRLLRENEGVCLGTWEWSLREAPPARSVPAMLEAASRLESEHMVLVDCTDSEEVAAAYPRFLSAGMHVVTANGRANTAGYERYGELRRVAREHGRHFHYGSTVGAGLPVVDTLRHMVCRGDHLETLSGVLSRASSFIFGLLDQGVRFSRAVGAARARGLVGPDPRVDLLGTDVARKLLTLMREAGSQAEMEDLVLDSVFPPGFNPAGSAACFLARLEEQDEWYATRVNRLAQEGRVLRMAAEFRRGVGRVGLVEVAEGHPLHDACGGEIVLAFTTRLGGTAPLVIRDFGTGAESMAAGVFRDLLRTIPYGEA